MKNFIIIGMPGSGKTSIGRLAAKEIGLDFIDLDKIIVEQHGNISDIFEKEGEDAFRDYETDILKASVLIQGKMISAGGGIIERKENIDILKKNTVIFIDREPDDILKTLDSDSRPLLKGKREHIFELYERRYGKYLEAMDYHVLNKGTSADCINTIVQIIQKNKL